MRIAVLASGTGSNFEAIANHVQSGDIDCQIGLVFSDKKEAKVLEKASKRGINTAAFSPKDFASKKEYEMELARVLIDENIDFLVLAGYMRLIGSDILEPFDGKIVNIHPSLLPSFAGLHGIEDAYKYGVKYTGVTVHYVDAGMDTGKIIDQAIVEITQDDTLESLEEKIHKVEHGLYPQTLKRLFNRR